MSTIEDTPAGGGPTSGGGPPATPTSATSDRSDVPGPPGTPAGGEPAAGDGDPVGTPSRAPRLVVLAVVLVGSAVALGLLVNAWMGARQRLDDARAAQAGATATLQGLEARSDDLRGRTAAAAAESGRTTDDLGRAASALQVRDAELAVLSIDQQRFADRGNALEGQIQGVASAQQRQLDQLVALNTCLNGVQRANVLIGTSGARSATAALQQVADACQRSLALVRESGGDDEAPAPDFAYDFADPSVLWTADGYFAYATDGVGGAVQVIRSSDLRSWSFVGEALGGLPTWAQAHSTWAPSVTRQGDQYFLYYTTRDRASGRQCISSAVADRPQGPFHDGSDGPLVCQLHLGGSIDPSTFQASDGTLYLVWKSEDETRTGKGRIWVGKLAEGFRALEGEPTELLRADRGWEGRTIEGPSMVQSGDRFFLFYSGNSWGGPDYREGWATCESPTGPCTKPPDNILIDNHAPIVGPGGGEAFRGSDGRWWMAYHAWTEPYVGWPNKRQLHIERLTVVDGRPRVGG